MEGVHKKLVMKKTVVLDFLVMIAVRLLKGGHSYYVVYPDAVIMSSNLTLSAAIMPWLRLLPWQDHGFDSSHQNCTNY